MSDSDDLADLVVRDGLGGGVITKSEVAVLLDGAVFRVDAFLAPAVGPDFPFLFPSLSEGVWCGLLFLLPPAMVVVVIILLVVVDLLRALWANNSLRANNNIMYRLSGRSRENDNS